MKPAILALLAALLLAPRPSAETMPPVGDVRSSVSAPLTGEVEPPQTTEAPSSWGGPSHSPTVPVAKAAGPAQSVSGIASWGDGWVGVVTRLPRGTRITVCGRLGCWSGRSVGYGPAKWTHRIADLSRVVFSDICGAPSMGLCAVTVTVR